MTHLGIIKRMLWVIPVVLLVFMNQPIQAQASGSLVISNNQHGPRYTEVTVRGSRYYYNYGIYYTGSPDNYIVVEAPEGAIIHNVPLGYESVIIEGNNYYRYHDVYYRHGWRGYEVVRVKEHDHGPQRGGERDHQEHRDNHRQ